MAANSAAVIAHIGNANIHPDWGEDSASNGNSPLYGIPYNVVHGNSASVTKVNVIIDNYPGESDIVPVPIPANAVIEGDYQNGPNPNGGGYNAGQRGDSHLIVWDEDNNIAYELYGVTRPSDPTLFPNNNGVELPHTDDQWHAAQETVWNMNTDTFRSLGDTSADAAGLSILAGLARPDEGLPVSQGGQGAIDHALRFTLPSSDVNPQYIYPASHVVNETQGADKLPLGARLRLVNTPAVDALISGLGPEAQIIAIAMQQYGLVLADIGTAMYVTGTSASQDANNNINLTWNMNDVLGLESLTAADFQVVNLTPLVTGLSVTNAAAGSTITIVGQNFSGAAGHLSVLFGSTPATSVTFVDDSHLTVVVPSGTGTVNVQVQSGVTETDPNNPADNVNNPIFGYGISAISAADEFTIGGPAVLGADQLFVQELYQDVLGRTGSLAELNGWVAYLNQTGHSLLAVTTGIEQSGEARMRLVKSWYVADLGRSASDAEAQGWVTMLANGASEDQVQAQIIESAEFAARANALQGTADPNTNFIRELYVLLLDRTPAASEVDGWLPTLATVGNAGLAQIFLETAERRTLVVAADYSTLLHRVGATSEVAGWVSTTYSLQNIRYLFESSNEFYLDG